MLAIIRLAVFIAALVGGYYAIARYTKISGWKKHVIVIFASFFVLGITRMITETEEEKIVREEAQAKRNEEKAEKEAADASRRVAEAYQLTENEKKVSDIFIEDDISTFIDGGDALAGRLAGDMVKASAVEASREYERNQVAGDQKYHKKQILLTGKVSSINSGLGNTPYLTLQGVNMFATPQVHFKRGVSIDRIANISAGQRVAFVCKGAGAIVGTAMFDDCVFADDFAREKLESDKEFMLQLKFMSVVAASLLPQNSSCFASPPKAKKCLEEYSAVSKKKEAYEAALLEAQNKTGIIMKNKDE